MTTQKNNQQVSSPQEVIAWIRNTVKEALNDLRKAQEQLDLMEGMETECNLVVKVGTHTVATDSHNKVILSPDVVATHWDKKTVDLILERCTGKFLNLNREPLKLIPVNIQTYYQEIVDTTTERLKNLPTLQDLDQMERDAAA